MSTRKESHGTDTSCPHPSSDKSVFCIRALVMWGSKTSLKNLLNDLYVNLSFIIISLTLTNCFHLVLTKQNLAIFLLYWTT